jgi:teichuronic acid biosynthesis glycosyltransferase TuaH
MRRLVLENYPIVITSIQSWEKPLGSNAKDIAQGLAGKHRVLFINPPDDFTHFYKNEKNDAGSSESLEQVQPNLWVYRPKRIMWSINWLPDGLLYDKLNYFNNKRWAEEIRTVLDHLQFGEFIFLNDSNMFKAFYLSELLQPALTVYYTRDNLLAVDFWKRHGTRLEPQLMQKSDLVLGNSAYLTSIAKQYNPHSVYVGQGCDLNAFDADAQLAEPPDLAHISPPRIGYIGALTSLRLDINLLKYTAEKHPEWNLILIGPEDRVFQSSRLHHLKNVHFLGSKKTDALAAYLQYMDVLINPQLLNEVTIGNYPRKVDEYLAMGKPVVAIKTETMEIFKEHVELVENLPQFVQKIEQILSGTQLSAPQKRVAFAHSHSWQNSVSHIQAAMSERLQQIVGVAAKG